MKLKTVFTLFIPLMAVGPFAFAGTQIVVGCAVSQNSKVVSLSHTEVRCAAAIPLATIGTEEASFSENEHCDLSPYDVKLQLLSTGEVNSVAVKVVETRKSLFGKTKIKVLDRQTLMIGDGVKSNFSISHMVNQRGIRCDFRTE